MSFINLLHRVCGMLITFIGLGVVAPTFAATTPEPLDLTRVHTTPIALTPHFEFLEDPGAAWTLRDVMEPARAKEFQPPANPSSAALGFSYTRSAVWLRLPVSNPGNRPVERMLEIN
jgi:hypothetical protein